MNAAGFAVNDRGCAFGDGLFETLFVHEGRVARLDDHLARLRCGLSRLGLPEPSGDQVLAVLDEAIKTGASDHGTTGVCKLVVTAGSGPRGYRRPEQPALTVTATVGPLPPVPTEPLALDPVPVIVEGVTALRGLKHLNRLSQVLAQQSLPAGRREGLMLDPAGRVVSGTMGNLFWRERGGWHTPPLVGGAIAGTRRAWWIETLDARVTPCAPGRLALAEAAFLCNAVSAWRPVGWLLGRALPDVDGPPADGLESVAGCWQPPAGAMRPRQNPWPATLSEAMADSCWGRVALAESGAPCEAACPTPPSPQSIER
ncbi:aminodeoxychorismate lyase [Guyparkeria sp. SB14A]|uniref:aminotransferase class IV n=1 Tax=Guyparkeria sp. SB14A TaxID=2571147 RepID=UPI0010AC94C4|nr:aminotransferase class IV [Guyparkeria sp. SB14A]TKA90503.1 aminodeoxychorismate lyase [Guyparkeria sp. SB14A]